MAETATKTEALVQAKLLTSLKAIMVRKGLQICNGERFRHKKKISVGYSVFKNVHRLGKDKIIKKKYSFKIMTSFKNEVK